MSEAFDPLSFSAFAARAKAGERLNVVFLGGSLTFGAQSSDPQLTSYRALMADRLESAFPKAHFKCWDAAIGGTGSRLGSFRLERDVLRRYPDLVFLDFSVNDHPFEWDRDLLDSYESIVRRLIVRGIPVVIAIFAVKGDVEEIARDRPLDRKHKEIAAAYGIPVGDAVTSMREGVRSGKVTADELWSVPPDVTHPGDEGYRWYADAVWEAFQKAVDTGMCCTLPETPLWASTYLHVSRSRLSAYPLPPGWSVGRPIPRGCAFDFVMSRWLDDVAIASGREAERLSLKVRAKTVFLFGEATPSSGSYEVRINGGEPKIYEVGAIAKEGNIRYVETLALGLNSDEATTVEIIPLLKEGEELRFESLCLAGGGAQILNA